MKYAFLCIICFLFFALQTKAQNYFWVSFSDKNDTEYSLSNPEEYLSDRAIERRIKQNITIDSLDLPPNKSYTDSVLTLNIDLVHASKWLNGITVKTDLNRLDTLLRDWSFVNTVQLTKPGSTNKSAFKKLETIDKFSDPIDASEYGASVHQVGMLNGQELHSKNYKGQGVQIAVIDAGFVDADILPAFDSLWHNNQVLGTKDILNLETGIFDTPGDYHGMSVLSCMGGNMPGELIGTAPKASYWLIRSEDTRSEYMVEEDNWVVAAEFADSVGVDVINSSLGYYEFDDPTSDHTYADMDGKTTRVTQAANIAASRGILVFTSAGNERNNPWQRIIAPSDGENVIGVGAVNKDLQAASFTSAGPAADGAIKPNVAAMGYQTIVQRVGGALGTANGTSFSSPVMAGMAACLWQKYTLKTAIEIKEVLEQSGHQFNAPDSLLGFGVPNMELASDLLDPQETENIPVENTWAVYPNPIQEELNIYCKELPLATEVVIELYTLTGQLLKQWSKPNGTKIVLSDIPSSPNGMFLLHVSTVGKSETFKLSKVQ